MLHQSDVGVDDDEKETTSTSQQADVREEFVSPTEKRQQQGTKAWATEQNKQFDRGRSLGYNYFSEKRNVYLCTVLLVVFPLVFFVCCLLHFSRVVHKLPKQVQKAI